jgi:hypothetical protein
MFSLFSLVSYLMTKNPLPLPHVKRKGRRFDEYMFLRIQTRGKKGKARG